MPIIDLQQRLRELGRVRAGETVETPSGTRRPAKLDHFRNTSHSRRIVEQVAELYGGTPGPWTPTNGGEADAQWAVTVTADRIPILVPPQSISQSYELWSGGGCQRRCDGEVEKLSGQRCLCDPDPARRACAVTTRLSVILREVQGLGVFRLESHGYYAAVELPQVAAFLEHAGAYVEAYLALEPRKQVKDGKTRHWLVPVLDVELTPEQLLAGAAKAGALGPVSPPRAAITGPAPKPGAPPIIDPDTVRVAVADCETAEELRDLWRRTSGPEKALQSPLNREAAGLFEARAAELKPPTDGGEGSGLPADAPPPDTGLAADPEIEALWQEIQVQAPKEWTSDQLDADVEATVGVPVDQATAENLRAYLDVTNQQGEPA
jgi:hypothetical protein